MSNNKQNNSRETGVLLAVSSLPSNYGIGGFGPNAYQFIDILKQMKMKIWQVLPLNPLGFGNSPYQTYSSFAGDSLYISIDKLINDGLLQIDEVSFFNQEANSVDYITVRQHKELMLYKAFINFNNKLTIFKAEYELFIKENNWLLNYAVFLVLKKTNNFQTWNLWSAEHKSWIIDRKLDLTPYKQQIEYEIFLQFIFYRQWSQLKSYANYCGVKIMGDIPIYTGFDSLDVWQNQEIFLLDENQYPTYVAGVPPDFFSKTGQRWGNPIYHWTKLEEDGFKFWIERLRANAKAFDIIRIDHFRAFDTYWKIPSSCETAIDGEWIEAPGYALFDKIYQELPDINIVAEDLGDLRKEVLQLRDYYNLKGMQIFQFVFKSQKKNRILKKTFNTIIYTGTHDNSTLWGWYKSLSSQQQYKLKTYFRSSSKKKLLENIIKYILRCKAEYVIFPIQDIIGLDEDTRFNTPGQIGSPNWEWKLTNFSQLKSKINFMAHEINLANR